MEIAMPVVLIIGDQSGNAPVKGKRTDGHKREALLYTNMRNEGYFISSSALFRTASTFLFL